MALNHFMGVRSSHPQPAWSHGGTADTERLRRSARKGVGVRVPLRLPMKKPSSKPRNPAALPAKNRKGGPMRNKKDKRLNGKNKQQKYLDENF